MTSVRESVRRRLEQLRDDQPEPAADDREMAKLSYRINWLRTASEWDEDRRGGIRQAVASATQAPGFDGAGLNRVYQVPELDSSSHAGASLVALLDVLDALKESEAEGRAQ